MEKQKKIYIVSRHTGAIEFLKRKFSGTGVIEIITHLTPEKINEIKNSIIIGVLPIHIIHQLKQNNEVYILILNIPLELRGKEMTAEETEKYAKIIKINTIDIEYI